MEDRKKELEMNFKKFCATVLSVGALSSTIVCSAKTSADFELAKVDSNTFTRVEDADVSKGGTSANASVYISDIRDARGRECDYQAVYVKVRSNGYNASIGENGVAYRTAYRNQTTQLRLKAEYRERGTVLHLWAEGRNPSLDCKISGTFYGN